MNAVDGEENMAGTETRGRIKRTAGVKIGQTKDLIESGLTADMIPVEALPAEERDRVATLIKELDLTDTQSILFFGNRAQQQLTTISDSMLEGVRSKDVGPAGESLNEMVSVLRGFDVDGLDPNRKPGFFERLFGKGKPVVKFLQEYEDVRDHIDRITDALERHKTRLLTDVTSLDRLYEANLEYFHTLEIYIGAGEQKLRQLDEEDIPALVGDVETSEDIILAQNLRDLRSARDDLSAASTICA